MADKKIRKDLVERAVQAYWEAEHKAPRYDERFLRIIRLLTKEEFEEYVRRTVPGGEE